MSIDMMNFVAESDGSQCRMVGFVTVKNGKTLMCVLSFVAGNSYESADFGELNLFTLTYKR